MPNARFVGSGVSVPDREIDNHRLARVMETSDDWIRERSGIESRRYVEPGVGSSVLGIEAARAAIADAELEAEDIDYIVCATMTPDHYFPGSATLIQHGLGISPRPALDIRQQCAGFAYGMQLVDALIRSGQAKNVLLVGTDVHTCLMPFSEATWELLLGDGDGEITEEEYASNSRVRNLVVLFGDAAGAMVFTADEREDVGILGHRLFGDGAEKEILHVPGVGSGRRPWVDEAMLAAGEMVPVMDGRRVFKLAVTKMPSVTKELLENCGYGIDDVDLLVMHQANLRINEAAQRGLGMPDERVHNNIQKYGNTTSATLPLCFHDARAAGKAEPGSLVAFAALGAGLHWGAVLVRL